MIGEISHFLSLSAVVIFSLILIFNFFFFFSKIHPTQLSLSIRLFNQACWLVFISFAMYMYLAINDDFSIGYSYHELETESTSDEDQESTGISASYTMGGMTLAGASNDVDNMGGTASRDFEGYEFTLSFAF